jgi:hypothetical protein
MGQEIFFGGMIGWRNAGLRFGMGRQSQKDGDAQRGPTACVDIKE